MQMVGIDSSHHHFYPMKKSNMKKQTDFEKAKWAAAKYKKLSDIVNRAYGYEEEKLKKVHPVQYQFGTYFPTGEEKENYKPTTPEIFLN